jgi:putative flippase GtrA
MRRPALAELGKHQIAALLATAVDFAVMIALVELASASPVVATVIGAACGAVTNFTLGRTAVFGATHDRIHAQALRYALVSATSLGLNALGMYLLSDKLGAHYVAARLATSLLVSVAWNFPLQRHFVFRRPRALVGP